MKRSIFSLVFLLPLTTFAADPPSTMPTSPSAIAAIDKHKTALKAAREAYKAALAKADKDYGDDLTRALNIAMKEGPSAIDEVKRIDNLRHAALANITDNKITVISAKWGSPNDGRWVDDTTLVLDGLKTGNLTLNWPRFGDPAPGVIKMLVITASIGDKIFTVTNRVQDHPNEVWELRIDPIANPALKCQISKY